jgi:hypothetical protein
LLVCLEPRTISKIQSTVLSILYSSNAGEIDTTQLQHCRLSRPTPTRQSLESEYVKNIPTAKFVVGQALLFLQRNDYQFYNNCRFALSGYRGNFIIIVVLKRKLVADKTNNCAFFLTKFGLVLSQHLYTDCKQIQVFHLPTKLLFSRTI